MIRTKLAALVGLCLSGAVVPTTLCAQDDSVRAVVVQENEDGSYLVRVDGEVMLAITEEMARKSLKVKADLLSAERKLAIKDSLLATYELVRARYDTTLAHQREYIVELEQVVEGYKSLLEDYKRLRGEPWLSVEGGLGATDDEDPAILVGVAIKRLRVWGFLQESNAGALLGVSLPIF
ncbi:MAG: hypothetical protein GWN99_13280 [Gemmatimonadetes bacterium]|uniref:Uncharacterized protein n=1 Tax=Candidatus Kutchimonas denitrificans TaxID=3056748 RepID=A0AAE4ZAW6_9BACT|nr:hypothetical protein [Gemmatimonadota bacterium]NIR75852.1 hypothetical protein [Candidatus Kutchimonas denitrificans]NIS02019.1 hypothetical protein [Gemmatimonadota bacterium]NIT67823.1 hypothetical protein [Gemmatimonadota bacterium]NIU53810.1 hypothetical protein [Gemmatimonadota bacterium]